MADDDSRDSNESEEVSPATPQGARKKVVKKVAKKTVAKKKATSKKKTASKKKAVSKKKVSKKKVSARTGPVETQDAEPSVLPDDAAPVEAPGDAAQAPHGSVSDEPAESSGGVEAPVAQSEPAPVSYTHLTLPTIYSV